MRFELYHEVVLSRNIPEANLQAGDVATLIDYVAHPFSQEEGAILEVFNAIGESVAVITVPVSAIAPLRANQVPAVRELSATTL